MGHNTIKSVETTEKTVCKSFQNQNGNWSKEIN